VDPDRAYSAQHHLVRLNGFWLWLAYMLAGSSAIDHHHPVGHRSFRMASYAVWPFGQELVDKPAQGSFLLGNVIWVLAAGGLP
jgi:uncharacterized membrane protein YccF (DUF307 family)